METSLYFPGEIMDLFISFLREVFGRTGYWPEYWYSPDPTITKLEIAGPWTKNIEVVDGKPRYVVILEDIRFHNRFIHDDFQHQIFNHGDPVEVGEEPTVYHETKGDILQSVIRIQALSTEELEADRLAYLAAMLMKVFRLEIMARSEGRLVDLRVETKTKPQPVMLDSNTECMMAEANATLYMRDIWTLVENDYTFLRHMEFGSCGDSGDLIDLLVHIYPEEEEP